MSADAGSSPWASSAWSWSQAFLQGAWLPALENDARQQDLRLECWSLQSLTSNRAGALVQVLTRACVLGGRRPSSLWQLCACTSDSSLHLGDSRIWSGAVTAWSQFVWERKPTAKHGKAQRQSWRQNGRLAQHQGLQWGRSPAREPALTASLHTFPYQRLGYLMLYWPALGVQAPSISLLC